MVTIHEFGHYTAGKLLKFKINEFSIGFGKSLYQRKSKKTGEVFSIRLVPLGGYCAFEGEDGSSEQTGAFTQMAPWKRLIVLFCGPFFNIVSAVLFSIILLVSTGYDIPEVYEIDSVPVVTSTTVDWKTTDKILEIDGVMIEADYSSPAYLSYNIKEIAKATETEKSSYVVKYYRNSNYLQTTVGIDFRTNSGVLNQNDVIWKINGTKIDFANDNTFSNLVYKIEGNSATITVKRNGEFVDIENVSVFDYGLRMTNEDGQQVVNKVLGITSKAYKFGFGEAIVRCVPFTFGLGYKVLQSLWWLVTGQLGLDAVGGPITTITTIASYTKSNFASFFIMLPLIAVNLGIFNLLPIPALDGSKMVFTTIEWIRGKPINPKVENAIHNIGFLVLIGLVLFADFYHIFFV